MKSIVTHTTAFMTAYRFGYTGHEQEGDLAEGVYTTQYRLLDMRLGRWMSVDPLFGKCPDMGAYGYCGGNPVGCWDPDGREGLKYEDENHNKIIEKVIVILVEEEKIIPSEISQNKKEEIIRENNIIRNNNQKRFASIKSEIEYFYNGEDGRGAQNGEGDFVKFNFKFVKLESKHTYLKKKDEASLINEYTIRTSDKHIVRPAIITTRWTNPEERAGLTTAGTIIDDVSDRAPYGAWAHELGHTLGLKDNDYKSGGLLNNPPQRPLPKEVDEMRNKSRNP